MEPRKWANEAWFRFLMYLINVWMDVLKEPSIHLFYAREMKIMGVLPFCVAKNERLSLPH